MKVTFQNTAIKFTHCHRMPQRSFFWKGRQFPVCARCTGIHLGYLSMPLFVFGFCTLNIWLTLLLIAPTYLDGLTQAFMRRESNNILRVSTGLMAGVGTMSLVGIVGGYIGKGLLDVIKML